MTDADFDKYVMREFINIVEAAQRPIITPEQAEKILSSFYIQRGPKVGINTKLWRGVSDGTGSGMAALGTGLYFAASKKTAASYGKVIEIPREQLPWNAFRFKSYNDFEIWMTQVMDILGVDKGELNRMFPDVRHLVKAIDPNADGIQVMTGSEAIFVKYPDA